MFTVGQMSTSEKWRRSATLGQTAYCNNRTNGVMQQLDKRRTATIGLTA